MYEFRDVNTILEGDILPSEALQINGDFIENLISEYRTLGVTGREALSPELSTVEIGSRDGSAVKNKRYPERIITVKYQLIAQDNEAFRAAYNKLAAVLNVDDAELIFNDELDKFFIGTPSAIGSVPPGRNAVTGEFEILCVDPFKYSVNEYVAEPDAADNSFLIDYNGTYKSFPTLQAEFYSENEGEAELTGNGDCGFVAFFNEEEKIIQLGDPDEVDTEDYAKSQTLVSQSFTKETAWNSIVQANWVTNTGRVSSDSFQQAGNAAIMVGHYSTPAAPSTSGTLLQTTSKAAKPYVDYKVEAKTTGRTADSVTVKVTVTAKLSGASGSGSASLSAGAKISLKNTKLYVSSTASSNSGTKTGTFYVWDASVVKGRIRITNAAGNVGKSGRVTGWVNVSDIGATASVSLGNGYGLKGSIQINGGDWYTLNIKSESASWNNNSNHTASVTVEVENIEAETTLLEKIKFKVERTDNGSNNVGTLTETACKDLEISTYTAPFPASWYLAPQTYGTGSDWHGPSVTRTIPADAAGTVGAVNCTLTYSQKMSIGSSSYAQQELGAFQALLISNSGASRKIVAGINIFKSQVGNKANLRFYMNDKTVETIQIDLSLHNKYFGNNTSTFSSVKTSTITKTGNKVDFNIGGIKRTFTDNGIKDDAVKEVTFYMGMFATKPALSFNGLYWAKLVKNNCDTFEDIPNKFSANDVVTADCKNGEVFLNDTLTPSLGALGNDWEDFYLMPGLNQIGFAYSDWVSSAYAPKFKIKYREVFI